MIPGARFPTPAFFDASIEVILAAASDANGLDFPTLFSAPDWSGDTKKRIILPAGVTRGITDPSKYLFRTGTGRGGELELIIDGTLEGAGAAASSAAGNTGGGVLNVQQSGVKLLGSGAIKAGGGSGGKGGAGSSSVSVDGAWVFWNTSWEDAWPSGGGRDIFWLGVHKFTGTSVQQQFGNPSHVGNDGATYTRLHKVSNQHGSGQNQSSGSFAVRRTANEATVGGNGGRGRGHDGANANGVAGGTNAGAGGNGGDWGANGTPGTNGNAGSGLAGGLAGIVINGAANLSDLFSGSKLGRII